jgi:hypothetical protein
MAFGSNKKPAFDIFSVTQSRGEKASWTKIGVAWDHNDGKGLNLTFNARPLESAKIVLRRPQNKASR